MFMKPAFIASAFFLALSVGVAGTAWAAPPSDRSCGSEPLSIDCGGAKATIQCVPWACSTDPPPPYGASCARSTLRLKRADGRVMKLAKPKGMERLWAVGLACTRSKDSTPYLVVQYDYLPEGGNCCEWFHLYTTQGRLLTNSDPPMIPLPKDATDRIKGETQMTNNKEFDALYKKLGFKGWPDIPYFNLRSQPGH
jgi:hypothetical protein